MSISFKVTVEVVLPNMIDREALDKEFNGNLRKALEFILDGEKVVGFSDSETIIKIEESDTPKQDGVAISSWAATEATEALKVVQADRYHMCAEYGEALSEILAALQQLEQSDE
jgi:tRNA splicing ligase